MDKEREYRLGVRAGALLKDDLFAEVLTRLRAQYPEQWASSNPTDTDAREAAYQAVKTLNDIEGELRRMENSARVEERKEQHRV